MTIEAGHKTMAPMIRLKRYNYVALRHCCAALMAIYTYFGDKTVLNKRYSRLGFCSACSQYTKRKSNLLFPSFSRASVSF